MSPAKIIPLSSRRSYVPDRPRALMYGAVMAAYHMFDELAPEVPPTERLSRIRKAMRAARATRDDPAKRAKARLELDVAIGELVGSHPKSWCDLLALAELAVFHAGAREFGDLRKAFDVTQPHQRLAAELIVAVLYLAAGKEETTEETSPNNAPGYVYLAKSGSHFKIGRTVSPERRTNELRIQLPDKLERLHAITSHDPNSVERYWHRRFADRRLNGEWFALSTSDVSEFCSWVSTGQAPSREGEFRFRIRVRAPVATPPTTS